MNGLLIVDKPAGMTSHDVISRVRRLIHQRRVGHTGTLDPFATGVLPLVLGPATRLSSLILAEDKTYDAILELGISTDTQDLEGRVQQVRPLPAGLDRAAIEAALSGFRGRITQVPPMYSALKVKGKPLHAYARAGQEIERAPREVEIHGLELLSWEPPRLRLRVSCSKGTYIRVLAADLGELLGCGAHLVALRRLSTGAFGLEQALTLEEVEDRVKAGTLEGAILPPLAMCPGLPKVTLGPEQAVRIGHGNPIWVDLSALPDASSGATVLLAHAGELLAVGEARAGTRGGAHGWELWPRAVLWTEATPD